MAKLKGKLILKGKTKLIDGKLYYIGADKIVGSNLSKKQRMDKIKKDTKKYKNVLMMG